jgi:hypothetical protein
MSATAANIQIEQPLLHDLDARQRQSRQLQARERADLGELDFVEFVQDLLGSEMDLDRQRQKVSAQRSMVSVADHGISR